MKTEHCFIHRVTSTPLDGSHQVVGFVSNVKLDQIDQGLDMKKVLPRRGVLSHPTLYFTSVNEGARGLSALPPGPVRLLPLTDLNYT